ncbi:Endogenous retrovirus group K member 7 Np9 protein [Frankliniella fusca]|uniref:Gustatory receptor n=1 Tax=Frankliniella fusca TaxID=407009 RepID=A0AAE1I4M6_9NEOP|nr:Endogenous retrovirus group K member 7 Np9 protein [Frankliniella fusca]
MGASGRWGARAAWGKGPGVPNKGWGQQPGPLNLGLGLGRDRDRDLPPPRRWATFSPQPARPRPWRQDGHEHDDGAPRPRRGRGRGRGVGVAAAFHSIPFLIWPNYLMSRLLGLQPLRFVPSTAAADAASSGADWLSLSPLWAPFCVATSAATMYSVYFMGAHFISVVFTPESTLNAYIYEVPMMLNALIALLCTGYSLFGARAWAVSWRAVLTTLAELDAVNRAPPSTSRRCRPVESWTFFAMVWAMLAILIGTHWLYTRFQEYVRELWHMLAVLLVRLVPMAVEGQYLLSCLLLERAYRAIVVCLRDLGRGYFPSDQVPSSSSSGTCGMAVTAV